MEEREDLKSMLPYLPVVARSSTLFWPPATVEILTSLERGPHQSGVDSGDILSAAISDIRGSLNLTHEALPFNAGQGYALYFDQLISSEESKKWFDEVVPALAKLLLQLPALLESHYQNSYGIVNGVETKFGLRILKSQESGVVLLSQELIGALLGCSFFCLFPVTRRHKFPTINFDHLFASLHARQDQKQKSKIRCIVHYFERICEKRPVGSVSFERKVLPLKHGHLGISFPDAGFWSNSRVPLCQFEAQSSGLIEDQSMEALEVDFANKYLGGGALGRGCVQEEIRFMINPELIAGMLFLPALADNESIEIIGPERFSNYTGYASSFRFSGEHFDKKEMDSFGRRKTKIIAIDALCFPGKGQYRIENLLRESNKAFCGFFDQSKYHRYAKLYHKSRVDGSRHDQDVKDPNDTNSLTLTEAILGSSDTSAGESQEKGQHPMYEDNIGIATGNWGCGAFGGDPELKAIIQWLAASQALRPFVSYYTFGLPALKNIDQVTRWIMLHEWTVGDLWNMMVEYSLQVANGETRSGYFAWLLPSA